MKQAYESAEYTTSIYADDKFIDLHNYLFITKHGNDYETEL